MRIAMAVSSKGGNTRTVAHAVRQRISAAGADVVDLKLDGDDAPASDVDAVVAGFWTDKGDCTPEMASLLEKLGGCRVVLFGTAGFGGSQEYFDRILDKVRTHLPEDATYLGGAMCQGRMAPAVRERYEAMLAQDPDNERIQAMIENFDRALEHPTENDIASIADAVETALGLLA